MYPIFRIPYPYILFSKIDGGADWSEFCQQWGLFSNEGRGRGKTGCSDDEKNGIQF